MAYPNNVGIKAMEIYVPGQVCDSTAAIRNVILALVQQLIHILRPWISRSSNNIRAFQQENTPSAWVSNT